MLHAGFCKKTITVNLLDKNKILDIENILQKKFLDFKCQTFSFDKSSKRFYHFNQNISEMLAEIYSFYSI